MLFRSLCEVKPQLVILMATGKPAVSVDFTKSTCKSYMAVANESLSSQGLSLTSTGFKVSNNTSGNVTSDLNGIGTSYIYLAYK